MTTALKQICNEVLESAAKATARPWACGNIRGDGRCNAYIEAIETNSETNVPNQRAFATVWTKTQANKYDPGYIVLAANNAEKLARALLVMEEMVQQTLHARTCNAPYGQMEKMPTPYALKEALARAEELMGEKK